MDRDQAVLGPYVPQLVQRWLHERDDQRRRSIPGTVVFADVSGFTSLTESLARRGKIGAEEMGDILNALFEKLLEPVYQHGGKLVKWGGDAVLLLIDRPDHAARALVAATEMQRVIRRAGRLRTSIGPVQLGMSIGIASGDVDFYLVGNHHRELIVAGDVATKVTHFEKIADAGEIVLDPLTVQLLKESGTPIVTRAKDDGRLVDVEATGLRLDPLEVRPATVYPDVDLGSALPAPLRDHFLSGGSESEHRSVAVGFLELAGFAALAASDGPDAVTDAIEAFVCDAQDAAARSEVTLVASDLAEDSVKLIYMSGAPRRVGDDEARVLTAMRSVIDDAGALPRRGGMTSGRVFAGDFGPPYRRTYSASGDSVNLAARLMATAEPGQLLTTLAASERVRGRFRTRQIPPFHVKGKTDPIDAVSVEAVLPLVERRATGQAPLVGRDHELDLLLGLMEEAAGGAGQVVDVVGPAGIGKTRLVEELTVRAGRRTMWVTGDGLARSTPYKALKDMLYRELRLDPTASRAAVADALGLVVREQAPDMVPWLPLLGPVVEADFAMTDVVRDLDQEARKERLEWVISELFGHLVAEPAVVVFHDAHLLDDASVDVLRRLVAEAGTRPWLVVAVYRPDERAEIADEATVIELGPLDPVAVEELVAALTDDDPLPAHRVAALIERAEGHPMFLEELVHHARHSPDARDLPDSVEEVVTSRIDRLTPPVRRTLRAAAVLGMVVELKVLDAVLRAEGGSGAARPDELRTLHEFVADLGDGRVEFHHHMARDAAYEGLAYRRRSRLHALTAEVIEVLGPDREEQAALLAIHCFEGARFRDAWRYSLLAAERALASYANSEAADAFQRAVEASRRLRDRSDLDLLGTYEALGDVRFELGEFDEARAAFRFALRLDDLDGPTLARLRMKMALVEGASARYSSSLRWITKGLNAVEDDDSDAAALVRGELMARYARALHLQGRDAQAVTWAARAVEQAERAGDDQVLAHALEYLDRSEVALGRASETPRALQSLEIYERLGDLTGQGRIHNSLGMRDYFVGQWPEALAHYRAAAEVYRRAGREWSAATAEANIAEVLIDQGRLAEAHGLLRSAMRVWRGIGAETEVAFGQYQLGRMAAREGRFDEAFDLLEQARRYCEGAGETGEVRVIDALRAEALELAGRHGEAVELAVRALGEALAAPGLVATVPLLQRVRAAGLAALGEHDEAHEARLAGLEAARERGSLHDVAMALRLLREESEGRVEPETLAAWEAEMRELSRRLGLADAVPV
ncbi:tetratricopeptide repeat protein [Aeromicrobium terrae]|nr:adenylate/guanylate cyclase domain-containing protein [Aeromicrobium terrae]